MGILSNWFDGDLAQLNHQSQLSATIQALRSEYKTAQFIALGQTVLWDEPVKAAVYDVLRQLWPQAAFTAGVHDTDYFAKSTALVHTDRDFAIMEHDDGATRGLWSAAGEISSLFGSEDIPTRAWFEHQGVPFRRLVATSNHAKAFYHDATVAYGWRGIVHTGTGHILARDVKVADIEPVLREQIEWALTESLNCLHDEAREKALAAAGEIREWLDRIVCQLRSNGTLSDLYKSAIPDLYQMLLGRTPADLTVTRSTELFQFNAKTAHRSRFAIIDPFINSDTAHAACAAYDVAVAGGGMYTLASFGEGALPFDVVASGYGRSTLRIVENKILLTFPETDEISIDLPNHTDRISLARALAATFGDDTVLVGKAVTFIDMLCAEYIVVFHETASGYTDRTAHMNELLRKAGVSLPLFPIMRIGYDTWSALSSLGDDVKFDLPSHLKQAFDEGGDTSTSAIQFANRWQEVIVDQHKLGHSLAGATSARSLLAFLADIDAKSHCWQCERKKYNAQKEAVKLATSEFASMREERSTLKDEIHALRSQRNQLQLELGYHFRREIAPKIGGNVWNDEIPHDSIPPDIIEAATTRRELLVRLSEINELVANLVSRRHDLRKYIRDNENSADILEARKAVKTIVDLAETARLRLARQVYLVTEGLPHTSRRPSAWWFPLVDQKRRWFNTIANTMTARLEHM